MFYKFKSKLLDQIDLIIEFDLNDIEISIKWSLKTEFVQYRIPYTDDECTLPLKSPFYYICSSSSKNQTLNSTFYSYWFLLESSFYKRLFSHITTNENDLILLISLADGRIIALAESPNDLKPIIWYNSLSSNPVQILGFNYDLNRNLLDAVLCAKADKPFPKVIVNHLILCESIGSLILLNSTSIRRILIDNLIKFSSVYLNNFIYITKNEIRSISLSHLLKSTNEDFISQTKSLRFGHFQKLIVDGQEIILYYENGIFERLNNLLPNSSNPIRFNSLSNQIKTLSCLTTTILNLQSNVSCLQKLLNKIEIFYQLNLNTCLKLIDNQWKLILNEQQQRIFQPNDFVLNLTCYCSANDIKIYQLISAKNWTFSMKNLNLSNFICQPILIFRHQNQNHFLFGTQKFILSLKEQIQEDKISIENYFPKKFKTLTNNYLSNQSYHLVLTIQNDQAKNFQKLNTNITRQLLIGQTSVINIECKQQEIKVDTEEGLVDSLTIQIILSSSCLRRLIITFSTLTELLYANKTIDDKHFIKQIDMQKLIDLIQETQTKLSSITDDLTDDLLLNLLQIRIYLSMFRLEKVENTKQIIVENPFYLRARLRDSQTATVQFEIAKDNYQRTCQMYQFTIRHNGKHPYSMPEQNLTFWINSLELKGLTAGHYQICAIICSEYLNQNRSKSISNCVHFDLHRLHFLILTLYLLVFLILLFSQIIFSLRKRKFQARIKRALIEFEHSVHKLCSNQSSSIHMGHRNLSNQTDNTSTISISTVENSMPPFYRTSITSIDECQTLNSVNFHVKDSHESQEQLPPP